LVIRIFPLVPAVPILLVASILSDASSGRVNMVYRRNDGNIGWIDPPTLAS
jgi:hypothetical protein